MIVYMISGCVPIIANEIEAEQESMRVFLELSRAAMHPEISCNFLRESDFVPVFLEGYP